MLFALGVSLIPSQLPKAQVKAFFDAFRRLPQRVIMRMERPEEDIEVPENVLLRSFLPQQAILAHPNVTLYFGHGGVNGLMEAIYYRFHVEKCSFVKQHLVSDQNCHPVYYCYVTFQKGDHCDAGMGGRRGQRTTPDRQGSRCEGAQGRRRRHSVQRHRGSQVFDQNSGPSLKTMKD